MFDCKTYELSTVKGVRSKPKIHANLPLWTQRHTNYLTVKRGKGMPEIFANSP